MPKPTSPMDSLLGSGRTVACKVFNEDLSVHWYATEAQVGDTCLCGKLKRLAEDDE